MSDKPQHPTTQQDLERELTAMTEPNTEHTELWREALQQTRRETKRGTRAVPGRRRRAAGLGALITASLAMAIGIGAWIGSTPGPAAMSEAAMVAPPPASSGMNITRSLDQMLPDTRTDTLERLLHDQTRGLGNTALLRQSASTDLSSSMMNAGRRSGASEDRELRIQANDTPLRDSTDAEPRESLLDAPAARAVATMVADAAEPAQTAPTPREPPAWRLLERRADIGIRVRDVPATADAVRMIVDTDAGEFVSEQSVQGEAHRAKAAVVLRVASARHDDVVDEVSSLGDVVSLEAQTEDLSLLADDLDARMTSTEKTERDFRDLYYNYSTPDFDNAARQLQQAASARSQVNDLMAERTKLVDRAAWSTIRVLIVPEPPPQSVQRQGEASKQSASFLFKLRTEAREALSDAGAGLLASVRVLAIALPAAAIVGPLAWVVWWYFRRRSLGE